MSSKIVISTQDIEALAKIVGPSYVKTTKEDMAAYGKDWTRGFVSNPGVVVLPKNTAEISDVLRYCNNQNIAVVPNGGRTGLAAAAFALNGELVLSLERLNKILEVDRKGLSMVVEAGVTTQAVQEEAAKHGLFFGLNLASKGSCQIGGNIATNAGGTKLIRYGGMREQMIGLEVVLADGTVLDMNANLRKNNTGYDLKQLFIGSEGTLGIVTKATVRLIPPPQEFSLVCFGVQKFSQILDILELANKRGLQLTAFEFFSDLALQLVLDAHKDLRAPTETPCKYYCLIEQEPDQRFDGFCEAVLETQLADDAVIASGSAQFHQLWALRENISESISKFGHVRKNDISLAIKDLDVFVERLSPITSRKNNSIMLVLFGHIGDGNIHINYVADKTMEAKVFANVAESIEREVFDVVKEMRGSISAEHGIGILKKDDLAQCRSEAEIEIMRRIKQILDPNGIMNPGKIF